MAPAKTSPVDLENLSEWRGLRPGMSHDDAMAVIERAGAVSDDDLNDPDWLTVAQWGMELRFSEEGEGPLRQIAIDDANCLWAGAPLLGQPLHEALEALGDKASEAGWRPENAMDAVFDDLEPLPAGAPPPDETLMDAGTLWCPLLRLGLVMQHGHVKALAWRRGEDVPRFTVSGVTASQLELSQRPDLESYLQYWRPRRRMTWLQMMLTAAFVFFLIGIAVYAAQEQQAWRTAPSARAVVTKIDPLPAKIGQKPFHLEFIDSEGSPQKGDLETADFYVAPAKAGDEAEVKYLLTNPVQVKGPARAQDAAFLRYAPKVIGAAAAYAALMTLAGWTARRGEWLRVEG